MIIYQGAWYIRKRHDIIIYLVPCKSLLLVLLECLGFPFSVCQMLHHQQMLVQRDHTPYFGSI